MKKISTLFSNGGEKPIFKLLDFKTLQFSTKLKYFVFSKALMPKCNPWSYVLLIAVKIIIFDKNYLLKVFSFSKFNSELSSET